MSKLETITIDTPSGSNTMQIGSTNTATINLGVSGDTINVPAGVTIANAGTATGFGMSSANTPMFAAKMSAAQTPSNGVLTLVAFDTEEVDTNSAYTNTAGNYKFTVPSGQAGKYYIYGYVLINALTNNDFIAGEVGIYKNGSQILSSLNNVRNTRTRYHTFFVANIFDLAVSDYVQLYASGDTDDGGLRFDHGIYSRFGGFKLT